MPTAHSDKNLTDYFSLASNDLKLKWCYTHALVAQPKLTVNLTIHSPIFTQIFEIDTEWHGNKSCKMPERQNVCRYDTP